MNIKTREHIGTVSGSSDTNESSPLLFFVAILLLGIVAYFFIQNAIPIIFDVICDFIDHSFNMGGGMIR